MFRCLEKMYFGNKVLCINVDASAWNSSFSDYTVTPVIRETVSRVIGNNLFNLIHKTYQRTLVYLEDEI